MKTETLQKIRRDTMKLLEEARNAEYSSDEEREAAIQAVYDDSNRVFEEANKVRE